MTIPVFLVLWIVFSILLSRGFRRWISTEPYMFDLPLPLWLTAIFWLIGALPAGLIAWTVA